MLNMKDVIEEVKISRNLAKAENLQRIHRVMQALLGKDERLDFLKILEYYQEENTLTDYTADRMTNPENY